jgi:thioesterase domain-containing protein
VDVLRWAALDAWRTRLLREADVASVVSQETSLLLVEMPAVRRILELVRKHWRLAGRYTAEAYPGRITLFRAVPSGPNGPQFGDPALGWGALAEDGVEIHTLRANHVALLAKPYVAILAQELRSCLDRGHHSRVGTSDTHLQHYG